MKLTVVCTRFKEINYETYRTEYWTKHIELTEEQVIERIGDILDIITKNIKEERAKNEELQNIELTESEGEEQ